MRDRVENDVKAVRGRLDYPDYPKSQPVPFTYLAAVEALDRLAHDAHECERLRHRVERLAEQAEAFQNGAITAAEMGHAIKAARG